MLLLTIDEIMENAVNSDETGFFDDYSIHNNYIDVKRYLWIAYNDIMERGYHKNNSYEVIDGKVKCTASSVNTTYYKDKMELTGEQKNIVNECIEAYKAFVDKKGTSDFSDNVIKLISANFIDKKYTNMIVFVPTFLINSRKFEAEKKAKQEQAKKFNERLANEFLGEIKEKITSNVTLIHCRVFENCFDGYHTSLTYNYTFIDNVGHLLQWKTTKRIKNDFEMGMQDYAETKPKMTIIGTVKAHNEFKGRYYTILTRCKIIA